MQAKEGKYLRKIWNHVYGKFRIPGSGQIPYPVKKMCVFPNPALQQLAEIPDPENTILDPFVLPGQVKDLQLEKAHPSGLSRLPYRHCQCGGFLGRLARVWTVACRWW